MATKFPEHAGVTEEAVKAFLDNLRESGITNMFGAGQYLEEAFGMSRIDAKMALLHWMENF